MPECVWGTDSNRKGRHMKKRNIARILILAMLCALLGGCAKKDDKGPFSVTFDLNGGSRVSGKLNQTVEKGEAAEEPLVERDGYIFGGWDTEFNNITKDTIVVAEWKKAIKITFDPAGGKVDSGKDVQYLSTGKTPVAPVVSKEGYRFLKWDKEIGAVREDTVYVAQWERVVPDAEDVYANLSSSMVEIHTYDKDGKGIALGSGFFLDENGTVLTNFHVMKGAYFAEIVMYDDVKYEVTKIEGYDPNIDLCVIETEAKKTKPVTIFDGVVKTGEQVYTLGSSVGLTGTFSNGIVSTASRIIEGVECIQTTAPISHGNSGGPLVNEFGEVLGVNTFMYTDGQNLNFAVSIKELSNIDRTAMLTMHSFGEKTRGEVTDRYTKVETGDEGEEVYEIADSIESEPNDTIAKASILSNGYWCAGYVDKGEVDIFRFDATRAGWMDVYLTTYWHDDDDYIYAYLKDANGKTVDEAKVLRSARIDIKDYTDDLYMLAEFQIKEAGAYYVEVHLPNDYPFKNGCYYMIGVDM